MYFVAAVGGRGRRLRAAEAAGVPRALYADATAGGRQRSALKSDDLSGSKSGCQETRNLDKKVGAS